MPSPSSSYQPISCANCGSLPGQHQPFIQTKVAHHGHLFGDLLAVVVCRDCGLVFLNPQPTPEALDQFYRDEYYALSPHVLRGDRTPQPQGVNLESLKAQKIWQRDFLYTWLVEQVPTEIKDWDILDIGCGYGVWLSWFDPSNRVAGIESSVQASQVARDLGIKVYQTDFMANQLPDEGFDLLTGLAIIEHFNDPLGALVEMNRLLKVGAYLYLQTPDVHGMVLRQGIARYFKVVHTYYYSLETLSSLLAKAGFEVVASRRRPPLVDTSGFFCPDNYWSGELDVLAVKREPRALETACHAPASSDDKGAVISSLESTLARDRFYLWYARLYRAPLVRIPIKLVFKLVQRLGMPQSIFEVQKERLE